MFTKVVSGIVLPDSCSAGFFTNLSRSVARNRGSLTYSVPGILCFLLLDLEFTLVAAVVGSVFPAHEM